MTNPQPPYGPQDPYQPSQEPPTTPLPQPPPEMGSYPPPTAPLPPLPADPSGYPPTAPQPPVSGAPYPPQPPVSGSPYPAQPGAYPPPGSFPPPAPGPAYPPPAPAAPGYPPSPVQPAKSNKKPIIIIAVIAAVLVLLCCVGGAVALIRGVNEAADQAERELSEPLVTTAPIPPRATPSSPSNQNDGETFNMKAGDTLVITDDEGTLEITVTRFRTTEKACTAYSPKPRKGLYLTAEITATVTKGRMSVNPFYFQWVASDGTTTNGLAGALSGCGDLLDSGVNLREGSKRAGTVTFDVADTNGALEYRHNFETAGSWKP